MAAGPSNRLKIGPNRISTTCSCLNHCFSLKSFLAGKAPARGTPQPWLELSAAKAAARASFRRRSLSLPPEPLTEQPHQPPGAPLRPVGPLGPWAQPPHMGPVVWAPCGPTWRCRSAEGISHLTSCARISPVLRSDAIAANASSSSTFRDDVPPRMPPAFRDDVPPNDNEAPNMSSSHSAG